MLRTTMMQCSWSVIDCFDDVNDKLAIFLKIYIDAWNLVASAKQSRIRRKKCQWMTDEILNSLHHRDNLYKSFLRMRNPDICIQYEKSRNRCTYLICQAKRRSLSKQPKKFWWILKAESGFGKKKLSDFP